MEICQPKDKTNLWWAFLARHFKASALKIIWGEGVKCFWSTHNILQPPLHNQILCDLPHISRLYTHPNHYFMGQALTPIIDFSVLL